MVHYNICQYLLVGVGLAISTVRADNTQDPFFNCVRSCGYKNFAGLNSHTPSETLNQIIQQANKPNDTFYPNGSHVICLFANKKFNLNFGGVEIGFDIGIGIPGSKSPNLLPLSRIERL
jgi:hypothetical protein